MRKPQICVIGNSSASDHQVRVAIEVGRVIARANCVAVTGGRGGIMEGVARGVHEEGGISVGILPSADEGDSNSFNSIIIPTGMGYTRNAINVLASDLVLVIGGEAGTLNEITFAWMYNKPIFSLIGTGGWGEKLVNTAIDPKRSDTIQEIDISDLPSLLRNLPNSL